jgi:hypothetical protein
LIATSTKILEPFTMPKNNINNKLVGKTVSNVRTMTTEEMETEGWEASPLHSRPAAIEFDDGTVIYAAADPEGNGPGALFGLQDGDLIGFHHTTTSSTSK